MAIQNLSILDGAGASKSIATSDVLGGGVLLNAFIPIVGTSEASDSNPLPVRGHILNPSATVTLPNSTTTYAVGEIVAASTSPGSINPPSFDCGSDSFLITGMSVWSNRLLTTTTGLFRLHLYTAAPTCQTTGDKGVFASNVNKGSARYLGALDFMLDSQHLDGFGGFGAPVLRPYIPVKLASGTTIWGLLEARANYARSQVGGTAAETLQIYLDIIPNKLAA